MTRVAIVVQRCHESIVGGSEALAWQYATLLRSACAVDVLTTTALDYATWANALPAGEERREGIVIRRFPVTIGRGPYWHALNDRWVRLRLLRDGWPTEVRDARCTPWSQALEEEYLRQQGPYSEPLLAYLERRQADYRAVVFITYLYPTTYFGATCVDPRRAFLVPTLHDEPTAHLKVFRRLARRMRAFLWLTEPEQRLGRALWGNLPGGVVGMAVPTEVSPPAALGFPYLLYAGRIDAAKGCDHLLAYFRRWKAARPSGTRLVLIGEDHIGVRTGGDVVYLGRVTEEKKRALMAGASAFVMPSAWESFSIATLEALAQRTPVLVNAGCPVLAEHVRQSGGGLAYADEADFAAGLEALLADSCQRAALGEQGRGYVWGRYQTCQVRDRLLDALGLKTDCRANDGLRDAS